MVSPASSRPRGRPPVSLRAQSRRGGAEGRHASAPASSRSCAASTPRAYTRSVRGALLELLTIAGAPPTPFESWLDAAARRGPTPSSGPLRHDLLLGADLFGLTIFASTRDFALESMALSHADRWGREVGELTREWIGEGDSREPRHAGLRWSRASGFVLKLYRGGSEARGADITRRGLGRRRSYRRVEPPAAALGTLRGYAHTLEARLEPEEAADGVGKTTTAVIFRPDAPLASLDAGARVLREGAAPWAETSLRSPQPERLRAAALELDRWDDGRESFDVLVTLAR